MLAVSVRHAQLRTRAAFEHALLGTDLRLLPISQSVLRVAARLRRPSCAQPMQFLVATAQHA
jgi:hypothetical protein